MAKWRGSLTERFLEDHEREFRWLMFVVGAGLVARFILEGLGLWPWA